MKPYNFFFFFFLIEVHKVMEFDLLYIGHYPIWDEEHPIHFVGHSAGAQVIRMLQQMLADKVLNFTSTFTSFLV